MATYTATLTDGTKQTIKVSSKAQLNAKIEEIGETKVVRVDRVVPFTQTIKQALKAWYGIEFRSCMLTKRANGYYNVRPVSGDTPLELRVMAYEIGLGNKPQDRYGEAFGYGNIAKGLITLDRADWEKVLKFIASRKPMAFKPELRKRMNETYGEPEKIDLTTVADKLLEELTSSIRIDRNRGDYNEIGQKDADRLFITIGVIDRGQRQDHGGGDDGDDWLDDWQIEEETDRLRKANQHKIDTAKEITERLTKCKVCVDIEYGEKGDCCLEIVASHK